MFQYIALWLAATVVAAGARTVAPAAKPAKPAKVATPELIATVAVGTSPQQPAVNPVTHKAYVPDETDNTVTVIDLVTNTVLKIVPVGKSPDSVTINGRTNRIYVSNVMDDSVTVLDGADDTVVATVTGLSTYAKKAAVNTVTSRLYVPTVNSIYVVDTQTNEVIEAILAAEMGDNSHNPVPDSATVNEKTNAFYVVLQGKGKGAIARFDGATNKQTAMQDITSPRQCKVNSRTNRLYVTTDDGNLSVLDGTTLAILNQVRVRGTGNTESYGNYLALDTTLNRVYTANADPSFSIFEGDTLKQVATVDTPRLSGITVDRVSGRVYISNLEQKTVSVFGTPQSATFPAKPR